MRLLSSFLLILCHTLINIILLGIFDAHLTYFFYLHLVVEWMYFMSISLFLFNIQWEYRKKELPTIDFFIHHEEHYPDVDIFIPTYNEDITIIASTIRNCIEINYPKDKLHIYILDDGNRNKLKDFCFQVGIEYIAREENIDQKPGNINHALKVYENQLSPFILFLDCDMMPKQSILIKMIGAFYHYKKQYKKLAYIQTPQEFFNYSYDNDFYDMKNSLFNKLMIPSFNLFGKSPYIGSGALFDTEVLIKHDGFITGRATEDVATGFSLHKKGYFSKYLYDKLAYGICPSNLAQAFDQKIRWTRGDIQLFWKDKPLFCKELAYPVRLLYFNTSGYWIFSFIFLYQLCINYIWIIHSIFDLSIQPNQNHLIIYQCSFLSYFIVFLFLPDISIRGKIRGLQMFITYIPVYIVALIPNCKIQTVSSKNTNRHEFHPLFLFHYTILLIQIMLFGILLFYDPIPLQISISIWLIVITFFLFYPVFRYSLCCFRSQNKMNPNYEEYIEKQEIQPPIDHELSNLSIRQLPKLFNKHLDISQSSSYSSNSQYSYYYSSNSSRRTSNTSTLSTESNSSPNYAIFIIPNYIIWNSYVYLWKKYYYPTLGLFTWKLEKHII